MSFRQTTGPGAALIALLVLSGCSGNTSPTQPTSTPSESPSQTASAAAPTAPIAAPASPSGSRTRPAPPPPPGPGELDGGSCLKLTGATLNLMSGASAEENRKAAEAITGFNPPDDVRAAVEHFVGTAGLQQSDPDKNTYSRTINNWVEKVCPV